LAGRGDPTSLLKSVLNALSLPSSEKDALEDRGMAEKPVMKVQLVGKKQFLSS